MGELALQLTVKPVDCTHEECAGGVQTDHLDDFCKPAGRAPSGMWSTVAAAYICMHYMVHPAIALLVVTDSVSLTLRTAQSSCTMKDGS